MGSNLCTMKTLFTFLFLVFLSSAGFAQRDLTMPEASQQASVSQRIGLTDISLDYHSPLVNNRTVWGGIVPYDEVWRAGANENTVITFSNDVKIEGKPLAAGSYGLHMIPRKDIWTIIFSKDYKSWGSFFYDVKNDALRIDVKPSVSSDQNWLSYSFDDLQSSSARITLKWEKLSVVFKVDVDVPETVYQNMQAELKGIPGFFPAAYQQASAYCIRNKIHLDDAETWINKSISMQKSFANLNTKADLMAVQGNKEEASLRSEAMKIADENELNAYGYVQLNEGNMQKAIEIFSENVKRYPESWNVYDSLAEAFEKSGKNSLAIANYKTALGKAPEAQRKRIENTIAKLESK